jgi:anti-sigma regulatory factor (Ser/Thr protein kinase)
MTVTYGPEGPGQARGFVRDYLKRWGYGPLCPDAALLTSELVTNAILHGREPVGVGLEDLGGAVCLSVDDASEVMPELRGTTMHDTSGRGLQLVEALSARWGVEFIEGAKRVWLILNAIP